MLARGQAWRVIDTGLRRAAENIALNRALLEAHQEGRAPHTLRFLRFTPSALIGFHQSVDQELDRDYCKTHGIAIQRRITGGGAIYFDETQLGWELYLDKQTLGTADMLAIARRICETAAAGIRALGVDARFRPRNDIEVGGRKLSGTGGAFDGDSILYQGTLLVDFDVEMMLRVLRIPAEKLSDKAIASARERVVNLKELLGAAPDLAEVKRCLTAAFAEGFGVEFVQGDLSEDETERFRTALAEIDTPSWVEQINRPPEEAPRAEGLHKSEGGLLRAQLSVDTARGRLKQVWITGDVFVNPKRMIADLEAALKDTRIEDLRRNVHAFFDSYRVEMLLLEREDFIAVVENALGALQAGAARPARQVEAVTRAVDVLVVGLGPGGASAAWSAASRGLKVLAIDRKRRIGEPVQCAEFLPSPMVDYVCAPGVLVQRIAGMKSFLPSGAVEHKNFSGLMVDRATFDRTLAERAAQAGAELATASTLCGLDPNSCRAEVRHGRRTESVGYTVLIAADGPHSAVARHTGLPELQVVWTRQYTVPLTRPYADTDIWLGADYPGGYGWLFPKGDLANVGLGADRRWQPNLKAPLECLLARLVRAGRVGEEIVFRTGGAIPVGGMRERLVHETVLFVGDAAGLTHPITGAGIAAAVQSGERAGEAAAQYLSSGDRARLAAYDEEMRELYGPALARALARRAWLAPFWRRRRAADDDTVQRRGWIAFKEYFQ